MLHINIPNFLPITYFLTTKMLARHCVYALTLFTVPSHQLWIILLTVVTYQVKMLQKACTFFWSCNVSVQCQ